MPGCSGWGCSWGAQEDGCFPTAGCSFSTEVCNWLQFIYIFYCLVIFLSEVVFLFLCISGFLFGDGEFSAHSQTVCFVAFWRNMPTVYSVKHFTHIKRKICEGLVCQRLYNEIFEFVWCVEWWSFAEMLSLCSREVCARPVNFPLVQC